MRTSSPFHSSCSSCWDTGTRDSCRYCKGVSPEYPDEPPPTPSHSPWACNPDSLKGRDVSRAVKTRPQATLGTFDMTPAARRLPSACSLPLTTRFTIHFAEFSTDCQIRIKEDAMPRSHKVLQSLGAV